MSGYTGNPDAEAEHALIISENGVEAARSMIPDGSTTYMQCLECGEDIPEARRLAQKGCKYCVTCQVLHDKAPNIKMLDRIL